MYVYRCNSVKSLCLSLICILKSTAIYLYLLRLYHYLRDDSCDFQLSPDDSRLSGPLSNDVFGYISHQDMNVLQTADTLQGSPVLEPQNMVSGLVCETRVVLQTGDEGTGHKVLD